MDFLTLLGLQNHFDAQLIFHGPDTDDEHLEQSVARTVICVGEVGGGLVLNLKSDAGSLSTTIAVRMLQDFAEVLTRLPEFADKNPAAIPVGSSRKRRLDVIQRIEEAR
jgi:hypothetical protein